MVEIAPEEAKQDLEGTAAHLARSCVMLLRQQLEVQSIESKITVSVDVDGVCIELGMSWDESDDDDDEILEELGIEGSDEDYE